MENLKVFVGENGKLPTRGSEFSAGWDLYSAEDKRIPEKDWEPVETDITVSIPKGWYGRIAPRSGLALKKGVDVGAGVVDNDFLGTLKVILFNHGTRTLEIKKGDRIAQLVITRYNENSIVQVKTKEELGKTERGESGFGSTGK